MDKTPESRTRERGVGGLETTEGATIKSLDVIAALLLVVGGLNWGLMGFAKFDLVAAIFGGQGAFLSRVIYLLVGFAAVYQGFGWKSIQRRWSFATVKS
jgi:uncharacterized membrane protein YuzA (DUF378 family)